MCCRNDASCREQIRLSFCNLNLHTFTLFLFLMGFCLLSDNISNSTHRVRVHAFPARPRFTSLSYAYRISFLQANNRSKTSSYKHKFSRGTKARTQANINRQEGNKPHRLQERHILVPTQNIPLAKNQSTDLPDFWKHSKESNCGR